MKTVKIESADPEKQRRYGDEFCTYTYCFAPATRLHDVDGACLPVCENCAYEYLENGAVRNDLDRKS